MTEPFDPASPSFPPDPPREGVTYGSYLRVEELLALQTPLSRPEHHDELLFILIHQVHELWFKQLLHELDGAVAAFDQDAILATHKIFHRVTAIQRVLVEQILVLETMTPQDFNAFRSLLNPASGFQSAQFRELEALSGIKDPRYLKLHREVQPARERLERRLAGRSVYDAFLGALARRGFDVPDAAPEPDSPDAARVVDALHGIYSDTARHYDLYLTCEYLIEYDELFQTWRFRHVQMVERVIGAKIGTGGSPGAAYLRTTLGKRFFPALWDVRTRLGASW